MILISSLVVVNYAYKHDAKNRIESNLEVTKRIFDRLLATRTRDLAVNAYLLSRDYGFTRAIASRDKNTLLSVLDNLMERVGADAAMLVSLDYQLIADTEHPDRKGTFFATNLIKMAEHHDESISVAIIDDDPHQMVIFPVLGPDPIAWFCISFKISDAVNELKNLTRSQISLVEPRRSGSFSLVATTLPEIESQQLVAALPNSNWRSRETFALQLNNSHYLTAVTDLIPDSQDTAIAVLQKSLDKELEPYYRLEWFLICIALLGLLFALMGSFLVARTVSNPVRNLAAGTREIGRGNYQLRIAVDREDEIGELGLAFNEMAERMGLQDSLRQAKENAESASRAKSEFLANMSHELRTPLNSILGYAQLLKKQNLESEKQFKALDTIERSGQHLLGLINEVLDLSKIEAGKMELQINDLNLQGFLENIAEVMRARADAKGLDFIFEGLSIAPQWVRMDEKRLRQVLMNLLDNAIKYTQEGRVTLRVEKHSGCLRFIVEDTGVGIQAEHLNEVFTSFHQVHDIRNHVEGTGLGLAISDKLVRLMGGRLEVTSEPGKGSQFWFDVDLPAASKIFKAVVSSERNVIAMRGDQQRILITDDRADNRALLWDLLSPLGFELREAVDGQDCIDQAANWKPHIILVDMQMPVMDGLQACRQIRKTESLANVVVIAISASAFEHHRKLCIDAGADAFLPKPLQLQTLLDTISRHTGLEPVYESNFHDKTSQNQTKAELIFPPKEKLEDLLAAAKTGDVADIRQHASDIQQLGPRYGAFAEKLITFSSSFQIKKIRQLLDRAIEEHEEG